jgi:hypothetical protein
MKEHAKKHFRRWLIQAPIGLVLIGAGVSMITDASHYRASGAATLDWFLYGTFALIVFNSGLSLFVGAAIHRMRYENEKNQ